MSLGRNEAGTKKPESLKPRCDELSNTDSIFYTGATQLLDGPQAEKVYLDPVNNRSLIRIENKDKAGVYA